MDVFEDAGCKVVAHSVGDLSLGIGAELASLTLLARNKKRIKNPATHTQKEKLLCSFQELVLHLGVCHRIESSDSDNRLDGVPASIIRVEISPQYTAKEGLEPESLGSNPLVAPLIDAVALQASGNLDFNAHVINAAASYQ